MSPGSAVIAAYRDAGCVPQELPRDVLLEMMAFLGCRPVDGPLAGLFFDDLQFAVATPARSVG